MALHHHFDVLERVEKGAHADLLSGIGPRFEVDEAHRSLDSGAQFLDAMISFSPTAAQLHPKVLLRIRATIV